MNLFFKSYRHCLVFFLVITWETCFNWGLAQDSSFYSAPWIQEILLPSKFDEIPNQSFYLDHHGVMFLGKANGLTIISGKGSDHLHMSGPVYITAGDSDTLYYAARNDFGLLLRNNNLEFHTISRNYLIPSSRRTFIPSDLVKIEDHLFINSNRGIYHLSDRSSEHFPFHGSSSRLYQFDKQLYLTVEGTGILHWTGEEFKEIVKEDQLGGQPVRMLEKSHENIQILTSTGDLYTLSELSSSPLLQMKIPSISQVSFIERINDTLLLADVNGDGIKIVGIRGVEINQLGNKGGLPEGEIRKVFNRGDETWILGPHTLHKINYPSALNMLEFGPGNPGRILTSKVTGKRIILGTSHGLFSIEQSELHTDQWILSNLAPVGRASIHLLSTSGNMIFAAGIKHLYATGNGATIKLDDGNYTGILAINPGTLVASSEKGITLYTQDQQGWKSTPVDRLLPFAHSFIKYADQVYFLCRNEAFRLSQKLDKAIPISLQQEDMIFKLMSADDDLLLGGSSDLYLYNENKDTFSPLPRDNKTRLICESVTIVSGTKGGYWVFRPNERQRSTVLHTSGLDEPDQMHDSIPVLQNLGEIIDLALDDSVFVLTGRHRVSMLNLHQIDEDKRVFSIQIEHNLIADRGIQFRLKGLEFQSFPAPLFRYRLIPGQEQWSQWNDAREILYKKLKPGEYVVEAQAKDLYGRISETSERIFQIESPFYRTWYAYTVYGFLFLVVIFLLRKWRLLDYQQAESRASKHMQSKIENLVIEKEKSDKLVADILPEKTASQLRSKGKAKWDKYERATVLFSDIQGFTKIAEEMNPDALIDELDKFFFHFDSVVEKYNIEKIKTIGDAYMAAGGIPEKNSTNPVEVVLAALEMQSYMQQLKSSKADIWDLRIGIHTGPVIAGVVGHKKVSYDLWGDTVNTASRMESSGIPGKVNISSITYGMVKEYFLCEYRGKLPVKYKGNIDMYFVTGLRPELSVDLKEIPNRRFFIKLQLLRLGDLEEKIFENILTDLPESLRFHTLEYARKIYNQSFLLCRAEEIEQEDRLLVRTSALMLFTGLTQTYSNYENRSSVISRDILPDFKYSETQIDQICNLILATKLPFSPHNRLEKILIDAKMEHLGHPDYSTHIKLLFQEMKEAGSKLNGQQFKKQQLELLYEFEFYTVAGQRLREVSGKDQMAILEQERWI